MWAVAQGLTGIMTSFLCIGSDGDGLLMRVKAFGCGRLMSMQKRTMRLWRIPRHAHYLSSLGTTEHNFLLNTSMRDERWSFFWCFFFAVTGQAATKSEQFMTWPDLHRQRINRSWPLSMFLCPFVSYDSSDNYHAVPRPLFFDCVTVNLCCRCAFDTILLLPPFWQSSVIKICFICL